MGAKTGIEWTDATWNPIIGCSRVSEGCRNCYAEGIAARFADTPGPYLGLARKVNGHAQWTGKISETKQLLDPLKWRKPKRVFVNSMSDLFHENVTDEQRDQIFAVMALCPQHTFQVLTKRPELMFDYFDYYNRSHAIGFAAWRILEDRGRLTSEQSCIATELQHGGGRHVEGGCWPLPNIQLGVSDEGNQHQRIDMLRKVPAAVRFISAEPLIFDPGKVYLNGIDWVICGGESGPGARPMHPDWARSLRDQCQAAGVPFFFKQWGEWTNSPIPGSVPDGSVGPERCGWIQSDGRLIPVGEAPMGAQIGGSNLVMRVGKKAAGALLDGREWKQFPEAK